MLDFRVRTFLTLCKYMNYTRAAEELHITQPAVTQQIKYLQDIYNVKLFEYKKQILTLTPEGQMLRDAMITFRRDEEKLRKDLLNTHKSKVVRFGATQTFGEYVLSNHLSSYLKRHPERRIHLVVDDLQKLMSELDSGGLDFLLVEGYFNQEKYCSFPWSSEEIICVCSPSLELPSGMLELPDLFDKPLLLNIEGSCTREILNRHLDAHNYDLSAFSCIHEVSAVHLLKQLVINGCGIAFFFRSAVGRELEKGLIREVQIANFHLLNDFSMIWRKGSIYEALIQRMFFELDAPNAVNGTVPDPGILYVT